MTVCEEYCERIVRAMETIRCGAACTEEELHAQVVCALEESGFDVQHEVKLQARCRIDFMCGSVGIEIKKSRPTRSRLIEQLTRYAACDQVTALIVAAPQGIDLPRRIGGKRVTMVALERLWGISLP